MASSDPFTAQTDLLPLDAASQARAITKAAPEYIDAQYTEVRRRTLRDYSRVLRKHRWLAAACFTLGVTAAAVYTLVTPRLYTAATLLEVPRRSPIQLQLKDNVLAVEAYDRNVNGASSFLATQATALKSRDLADRVIRTYDLVHNAAFNAAGPTSFQLPSLRALLPAALQQRSPHNAASMLDTRLPDFLRPRSFDSDGEAHLEATTRGTGDVDALLLNRYMGALQVQDLRGTDLIQVSFTTPSPDLSAFLAAAHTQAYLEENQAAQVATDSSAMDFLRRQLEQARDLVDHAATAVSRFAAEHPNVALNQENKVIGKQIGGLAKLLTEASGVRMREQSRYEYVRKAEREPLVRFFDANPAIQQLRLAMLDVDTQRAALQSRLGPNHPQMVDIERQGAQLHAQLRGEVEQEVAAARGRFSAARLHEKELRQQLGHLERTVVGLRALGGQYDLLTGELDNARALHTSLLRQQTETAVHSQLDAARVRVIEKAEVPMYPSTPNARLNLLLGALAGLGTALAAVFLRETLDTSVKSSDDVEDLLQIPTLAAIPHFASARRSPFRRRAPLQTLQRQPEGELVNSLAAGRKELVVLHEPRSAISETFRRLRTAVLYSTAESPQLVLCTSAEGSEGKTVTALNLAIAIADAGSRVLLIDADLRAPSCHRVLGVDNSAGLSNVLAHNSDPDSVVIHLSTPRLSFIPAGPVPSNPAELIGSPRMHETLAHLRERYDFIIIDSPPVLPVTDAVVLSREADGVMLVVKGQDTPRDLVRRARDQLLQAGANVIGAVVNGVTADWGDLYAYRRYGGAAYASRNAERYAAEQRV